MYEFEVPFLLSVDMHYRIDFPRKLLYMKNVARNDLATLNNNSQSLIHMLVYFFYNIKTDIKWYILGLHLVPKVPINVIALCLKKGIFLKKILHT